MEMVFIVKGLDCANCAMKLQEKIKKVESVKDCTINFMTRKLLLNIEDETKLEKIVEICKVFEDGVTLTRIK